MQGYMEDVGCGIKLPVADADDACRQIRRDMCSEYRFDTIHPARFDHSGSAAASFFVLFEEKAYVSMKLIAAIR